VYWSRSVLKPSSLTRTTPPQPPRRRCLHIRLAPPPTLVCLEPAAPSLLFSAFFRTPTAHEALTCALSVPVARQLYQSANSLPRLFPEVSCAPIAAHARCTLAPGHFRAWSTFGARLSCFACPEPFAGSSGALSAFRNLFFTPPRP
jgi:hypothetical protein